jgi:hypothetical protein
MFAASIAVIMSINWNHYAIRLFLKYERKHVYLPAGIINTAKRFPAVHFALLMK